MIKRLVKRLLIIIAVLFTVVIVGSYLYLPIYVQNRIIPDALRGTRWILRQVSVRHIGLFGADLGLIDLTGPAGGGLEVQAVRISYSPQDLWRKKISAVDLIGPAADIAITDNGICIAGQCIATQPPADVPNGKATGLALDTILPIRIDRIDVHNGELHLRWRQQTITVAMKAHLETGSLPQGKLAGEITLTARDNTMHLRVTGDGAANEGVIEMSARRFAADRFSDTITAAAPDPAHPDMAPATNIKAVLNLDGRAVMQLRPAAFKAMDMTIRPEIFRIDTTDMALHWSPPTDDRPDDGSFRLTADNLGQWRLAGGAMVLERPIYLELIRTQVDMGAGPHGWHFDVDAQTWLSKQIPVAMPGLSVVESIPMVWRFTGDTSRDGRVEFHLKGHCTDKNGFNLSVGAIAIKGRGLEMTAEGRKQGKTLQGRATVRSNVVDVMVSNGRLHIPGVVLTADAHAAEKWTIDTDITLSRPSYVHDALSAGASSAQLTAQVEKAGATQMRVNGRMRLRQGRIRDSDHRLIVKEIGLDLPIKWPATDGTAVGSIEAGDIQWMDFERGRIHGTVFQSGEGIGIKAVHSSRMWPGLNLSVEGAVAENGGRLSLDLPGYTPDRDIDLGRFTPSAAGYRLNGHLTANARLMFNAQGLSGSARMKVADTRISRPDGTASLEGISGFLVMDQLPELHSEPRQQVQVNHMRMGTITADDLRVDYQIESPGALFIEKADMQWCHGSLHTQSVRIRPDRHDWEMTLFADQLNLAAVLDQFGVAKGEGDGSLNGRIPVRWHNGQPVFDHGFLYSTPGQSGTIHLYDTGDLLRGMPHDTPQFTQLDIATEALKDYTYDWAKMNLTSEHDVLKIGLKLNGRPNKLLPFTYDRQTEQFQRAPGQPLADFKAIGFDLNFSSSLNNILQFKALFNLKK